MNPFKPNRYYPHALLLIGSSACIALVLYGPTPTRTHRSLAEPQASVPTDTQQLFDDIAYSRTYNHNLADLLREARSKVMRMRMMDKFDQAEETAEQRRVSLDLISQQHQTINRSDPQNMLAGNTFMYVTREQYAVVPDPLAWSRPDELPAREYIVLGYGEIDNDQLAETQFLEERTLTASATLPASIAGSDPEADTQVLSISQAVTPTASPTTSPLADPAVVLPVQASQASRSVPLQSIVAQPVTEQPVAEKTVVVRPAPVPPATPAAAVPPTKTAQTQTPHSPRVPTRSLPNEIVSLDRNPTPAVRPQRPTAQPAAFTPSVVDTKPVIHGDDGDDTLVSKPKAPAARPATLIPSVVKAKPQTHSDEGDDILADAPGRLGFTPSAKTPLVSLPGSPVISKAQGKLGSDSYAPTPNNRPTTALPTRVSKTVAPVTESTPATPQFNQPDPLVVYVEDYEKIGDNKLNAIRNAIGRINNDTDLPVQLELSTDSSRAYDIRFREDASDDLGNKLGVTTTAYTEDIFGNQTFLRPGSIPGFTPGSTPALDIPEITLNSTFNWFAGNDANDIADDQYDYETAVSHEYLHALGLGDDFDNNNAVSYGLLSPGETRRQFNDNDRDELADLYENFNTWDNRQVISVPGKDKDHRKDKEHGKDLKIRYKTQALTAAVPEPVSAMVVAMGALVGMMRRRR
jgi:hypothetical protein